MLISNLQTQNYANNQWRIRPDPGTYFFIHNLTDLNSYSNHTTTLKEVRKIPRVISILDATWGRLQTKKRATLLATENTRKEAERAAIPTHTQPDFRDSKDFKNFKTSRTSRASKESKLVSHFKYSLNYVLPFIVRIIRKQTQNKTDSRNRYQHCVPFIITFLYSSLLLCSSFIANWSYLLSTPVLRAHSSCKKPR